MVIDIDRKSLAVVKQPIPKAADKQQIDAGWTSGYGVGNQSLQPVGRFELALHRQIYITFSTIYNKYVVYCAFLILLATCP